MARLFADENFPYPVVEELRILGHDVLTLHETGWSGQRVSDEEVLQTAMTEQRAVLTLNRKHFIQLHRRVPNRLGIIVCTTDTNFNAQAQRIPRLSRS